MVTPCPAIQNMLERFLWLTPEEASYLNDHAEQWDIAEFRKHLLWYCCKGVTSGDLGTLRRELDIIRLNHRLVEPF